MFRAGHSYRGQGISLRVLNEFKSAMSFNDFQENGVKLHLLWPHTKNAKLRAVCHDNAKLRLELLSQYSTNSLKWLKFSKSF